MANTKIQSEQIADSAITTDRIAADAITTAKIADSVALGGSPTTTTQSGSDNSTKIATTEYVTSAISSLIDSAPSTLNTLNEIAAALNDDANFNTTVTNSIAAKLPLAGGTMTGALNMGTQNITNAGTIASGAITTTASQFKYVSNTDSNVGLLIRDETYVSDEADITASRLSSGNSLTLGLAGQAGINYYVGGSNVASLNSSGNATFAGTISSGAITSSSTVTGTQLKGATGSTTAAVLKLEDAGVATYDFSFPDTGTILLGVNDQSGTTSNKVLKLLNAGSGTLGLDVEGDSSFSNDVTVGGDLTVDSNVLHVNSTNNNVGIGDANPPSNTKLTIQADGIGLRLDGTGNTTRSIFFRSTTSSNPAQIYADGSLLLRTEDANTDIRFQVNDSEKMRLNGSSLTLKNTANAPTNSVSNPPQLIFEGQGWDSNSGSDDIKGVMAYSATYGDFGAGATQGAFRWSIQGAGGLHSDTPESLREVLELNAQGDVRFGATSVYTNGYSRNISIIDNYDYGTNDWGEYMSWIGTNIKWNYSTDTWMRATQHSNYNWGGISGIAYLSDSLDFVVAPANSASGDGAESNVSDLKALVKMKLQADGKLGINTYSPNGRLEVEVNEGEAGFLISSSSEDNVYNKTQTIQTVTSLSGSNVFHDVAYIGHSCTLRVMGKSVQSGDSSYGGASADATVSVQYGSGSATHHHTHYLAMNGGDVTGNMEYRYLNSGASSGNYRLQVRMPYSGGSHKIYTTITGMSHDYIKEDD